MRSQRADCSPSARLLPEAQEFHLLSLVHQSSLVLSVQHKHQLIILFSSGFSHLVFSIIHAPYQLNIPYLQENQIQSLLKFFIVPSLQLQKDKNMFDFLIITESQLHQLPRSENLRWYQQTMLKGPVLAWQQLVCCCKTCYSPGLCLTH